MAAESGAEVHHFAPRLLLGLFDAAAGGIAEWSEFLAEAERLSVEVRGISREDLRALIESSTSEIPATEHRTLHQEASDFVRWGRRGGQRTLALYGRTSRCSQASLLRGPPYIITSDYGFWTAPGRRSIRFCVKGYAYVEVAIPNRASG
jgi:hypothetical protein